MSSSTYKNEFKQIKTEKSSDILKNLRHILCNRMHLEPLISAVLVSPFPPLSLQCHVKWPVGVFFFWQSGGCRDGGSTRRRGWPNRQTTIGNLFIKQVSRVKKRKKKNIPKMCLGPVLMAVVVVKKKKKNRARNVSRRSPVLVLVNWWW